MWPMGTSVMTHDALKDLKATATVPGLALAWMVGERTDAALNWHLTRLPNAVRNTSQKITSQWGFLGKIGDSAAHLHNFNRKTSCHGLLDLLGIPEMNQLVTKKSLQMKFRTKISQLKSSYKDQIKKSKITRPMCTNVIFVWSWHDFGHFPSNKIDGKIIHSLAHVFCPESSHPKRSAPHHRHP